MRNELRRKLLTEYAVALVAERESWERLRDPELTEVERCRMFGQWKQSAACLKEHARWLREAEPPAVFRSQDAAPTANEDSLYLDKAPAKREDVVAVVALSPAMPRLRRPFDVRWLAGSLRLITLLSARFQAAMPRVRSP